MLIFSIPFQDLIKFVYFDGYPRKKGLGERRLKDRVT
jgi:hypothetical protein